MAKNESFAERAACRPLPLNADGFNPRTVLPHGLEVKHVLAAMQEFIDFLGFINPQLRRRNIPRLESFMMPANFSSLVGECINAAIPRLCSGLAKISYHN